MLRFTGSVKGTTEGLMEWYLEGGVESAINELFVGEFVGGGVDAFTFALMLMVIGSATGAIDGLKEAALDGSVEGRDEAAIDGPYDACNDGETDVFDGEDVGGGGDAFTFALILIVIGSATGTIDDGFKDEAFDGAVVEGREERAIDGSCD